MAKVEKRFTTRSGEVKPKKVHITEAERAIRQDIRESYLPSKPIKDGRIAEPVYDQSSFAGRIRAARLAHGVDKTQEDISRELGLSRAAVAQWERGKTVPQPHTIIALAKYLRTTPEWLAFGIKSDAKVIEKTVDHPDVVFIDELVFDGPDNSRKVGTWGAPKNWVEVEVRPLVKESLIVVRCDADNMAPKYLAGDKLLIDAGSRKPSPPGVFAHWDGMGVAINQITVIPGSEPIARVSSTDGSTPTYEVPFSHLTILGRVRGAWKTF